jgi:hypothetical protein
LRLRSGDDSIVEVKEQQWNNPTRPGGARGRAPLFLNAILSIDNGISGTHSILMIFRIPHGDLWDIKAKYILFEYDGSSAFNLEIRAILFFNIEAREDSHRTHHSASISKFWRIGSYSADM